MRLNDQQRAAIRATVAETFGTDARVWLFGSRVDDAKRGGDIDLLIETDQVDADALARTEIAFLSKIQMRLHACSLFTVFHRAVSRRLMKDRWPTAPWPNKR